MWQGFLAVLIHITGDHMMCKTELLLVCVFILILLCSCDFKGVTGVFGGDLCY